MNRNDELGVDESHKTPRQVANYMRATGARIGRKYKTHGDVWDDSKSLEIGLLHLILDQLEYMDEKTSIIPDPLEIHRIWLNNV